MGYRSWLPQVGQWRPYLRTVWIEGPIPSEFETIQPYPAQLSWTNMGPCQRMDHVRLQQLCLLESEEEDPGVVEKVRKSDDLGLIWTI